MAKEALYARDKRVRWRETFNSEQDVVGKNGVSVEVSFTNGTAVFTQIPSSYINYTNSFNLSKECTIRVKGISNTSTPQNHEFFSFIAKNGIQYHFGVAGGVTTYLQLSAIGLYSVEINENILEKPFEAVVSWSKINNYIRLYLNGEQIYTTTYKSWFDTIYVDAYTVGSRYSSTNFSDKILAC